MTINVTRIAGGQIYETQGGTKLVVDDGGPDNLDEGKLVLFHKITSKWLRAGKSAGFVYTLDQADMKNAAASILLSADGLIEKFDDSGTTWRLTAEGQKAARERLGE